MRRRYSFHCLIIILEYLTIGILILSFSTPYATSLNRNYYLPEMLTVFITVLLLFRIGTSGLKRSTLKRWLQMVFLLYVLDFIILIFSVGREHIYGFVMRFCIFLPLLTLLFAQYSSWGESFRLLEKYTKVMTYIAVISLFFWVLASQLHLFSPTSYIWAEHGGAYQYPMYFGIYTERQDDNYLFYSGLRNQGIFNEAPMYNFALSIAIAFELFIAHKEKVNQKRRKISIKLIILIITMVTTTSTTGLITVVLMAFMAYILTAPKSKTLKVLKFTLFGFVLLFCIGLLLSFFYIKNTQGWGWALRADEFKAGILAWLSSPIVGVGYANSERIGQFRSIKGITGTSNSLAYILAQGGLVFALIYLIPLIGGLINAYKRKKLEICAFGIAIFIEFIFTSVSYKFLMFFLLAFFNAGLIEGFHDNTIHLEDIGISGNHYSRISIKA